MKLSVMELSNKILHGLVGLIYPPRCQMCGESLELSDRRVLCDRCHNSIRLNTPPFCRKCGKSIFYENANSLCEDCRMKKHFFDATYAVCIYDGVIRECIHNFKYNAKLALEKIFKDLMIEFAEKYMDMSHYDWLIPVPLHVVKHRVRTFNQSAILGAHLSKRFNIPISINNLIRTRLGKPLFSLSKSQRLRDIKDSFRVRKPSSLKGKSVLLVDDVFTTGATANECSKVLKTAGAGLVEVLTLARGE